MFCATRWRPDTCGCDLEYEWDDTTPLDNRPITYRATLKTCPQHSGLSSAALYAAVLGDNQRKNKVYGNLIQDSTFGETFTNANGQIEYRFKSGITLSWYYTGAAASRVLHLVFTGITLTPSQRTKIINWCNANVGVGRVVVD